MRFVSTPLPGVFVLEPERHCDERGWFARTFCADELAAHDLESPILQCSVSFNHRRGTLRGMHYQAPPHAEVKIVRCTRGAMFDVAADVRPDSPTFRSWFGVELTPENGRALYIPRGFAHGFLTLADATEVSYAMSQRHNLEAARGLRYDDQVLSIAWPARVEVICARDRDYPDATPATFQEMRRVS